MPLTCPFCDPDPLRVLLENEVAIAILDAFSVSNGHTLVVPRRHVASLFDLPVDGQSALWRLVAEVRAKLQAECDAGAFNIGVNDGQAAGQTVAHAHIHIIPRYSGDVADPRGGIRWVVRDKARYWREDNDPPSPDA